MPNVQSTAYFSAGAVMNLSRSCLNDIAGNLFSDAVLIPYLNSAYRKVRRSISMAGGPLFIMDNLQMILPAVRTPDASVQTVLNDAGYNNGTTNTTSYGGFVLQLPVDLLEPSKLEERPALTGANYQEMTDVSEHGGLMSQIQGQTLGMWEWRTDGIFFIGATIDTEIRIRYKRILLDVSDGRGQILIRDSQDCIAYLTAAMAAMARGSPLVDKWAQAGEDGLENLIAAATRREQNTPRRRRPFSSRNGGYSSGGSMNW